LGINDLFNVLRGIFSLGEIQIFEANSDRENFFMKVNTFKRF
jgi:hypothetical protein